MLEVSNAEVYGLERAIRATGLSFSTDTNINTSTRRVNDWGAKSEDYPLFVKDGEEALCVQEKDFNRASKLGGNMACHQSHDSWLRGITVDFDVKYPLYWSPEFQRYHFAEIIMSQSTMHRLTTFASSPNFSSCFNKYVDKRILDILNEKIDKYNSAKLNYDKFIGKGGLSEKCAKEDVYKAFMELRSNLPSGFEMSMTVKTNYLQLKTIYIQRTGHKLKEDWGAFLDWCDTLPYFKELTGCSRGKPVVLDVLD